MDKNIIEEEVKYLDETKKLLSCNINKINKSTEMFDDSFKDSNSEYFEFLNTNSHKLNESNVAELYNLQSNLEDMENYTINIEKDKKAYNKMLKKPYFARIDIKDEESIYPEKYYLGLHSLVDDNKLFKVLDWRSPIASIFYEYEKGKCQIKTNSSILNCDLINKRQYGISNGNFNYYIDTTINIEDEILQEVLSKNTSNKMQSIIQTIQKEQNEIIRCQENKTLIVQGVAGSGKTAIALHRIAYLLYKFKNKITSKNFMFLSPNNAFSSYISSVLPDLAEDDIDKIQLDLLAKSYLKKHCIIEKKYEQIERLITSNDFKEYKYKISYDFLNDLIVFANENYINNFDIDDFTVYNVNIDSSKIKDLFLNKYIDKDIFTRVKWISENIFDIYFYKVKNPNKIILIKEIIFSKIYKSIKNKNCVRAYLNFLKSKNLKLNLIGNKVKNEDAYGILFFKSFIFGLDKFENIKHLVIDEMQDYSALQMYLLNKLFDCPKTILGDYNQMLSTISFDKVKKDFSAIFNCDIDFLNIDKSYRSTAEIIEFYNKLSGKNSQAISRHGDKVETVITDSNFAIDNLLEMISEFKNKGFKSIAIITKTNSDAKILFDKIHKKVDNLELIDDNIDTYHNELCIISAYNSKGLEFDGVIVYDVSTNYNTEIDKNLLYIACSRPLHKLSILSIDSKSKFLV